MGEFLFELVLDLFGEFAESGVRSFLHNPKIKRGVKTLVMGALAAIPAGIMAAIAAISWNVGRLQVAWAMGLIAAALAIGLAVPVIRGHCRSWEPKAPKRNDGRKCYEP